MQIGVKFSIAAHILLGVAYFSSDRKVTGEFLAASCGVNPVIVRNITRSLKAAGLIAVNRGIGGITLARKAEEISLKDIFLAIKPIEQDALFKIHTQSERRCPVGKNSFALLAPPLENARAAMENSLAKTTLFDLLRDLDRLLNASNTAKR
jgi:DNA-binding IscR family transcriptional regulator